MENRTRSADQEASLATTRALQDVFHRKGEDGYGFGTEPFRAAYDLVHQRFRDGKVLGRTFGLIDVDQRFRRSCMISTVAAFVLGAVIGCVGTFLWI